MTQVKVQSATSAVDIRSSGIAHTAASEPNFGHSDGNSSSNRRLSRSVLPSAFHFKKRQRIAVRRPYDQKSLKLVHGRLFITKIAVCKFAIGKPKLDLVGLAVFSSDEKTRNASNDGDANRPYNSGD